MQRSIFVAYFTGAVGQSVGLFYIGDGVLAGVDLGGIKYDGSLVEQADGSFDGVVKFAVPAGASLITGMTAGGHPQEVTTTVKLPKGFDDGGSVVRIETPTGPVNAKFERLRDLP